MTTFALSVENLNFHFPHHSCLFFENLSFKLETGKLHHLKGKNGSGKSTLFSLLRGEKIGIYGKAGSLSIHQRTYATHQLPAMQASLQQQLVLVNQRYDTLIADQFSFHDNLKFACLPSYPSFFKKLPSPLRLPGFIERLNIHPHTPAHLLSGGQRQILALTMALQRCPSILLLDEPTATLDPANARLVFQFLKELIVHEHLTVLAICHDHELIGEFCDGQILEIEQQASKARTMKKNL